MEYYLSVLQNIGFHTLLGLSAYILLLTGQLSLAQVGFFAIGAYTSAIITSPISKQHLGGYELSIFIGFKFI